MKCISCGEKAYKMDKYVIKEKFRDKVILYICDCECIFGEYK